VNMRKYASFMHNEDYWILLSHRILYIFPLMSSFWFSKTILMQFKVANAYGNAHPKFASLPFLLSGSPRSHTSKTTNKCTQLKFVACWVAWLNCDDAYASFRWNDLTRFNDNLKAWLYTKTTRGDLKGSTKGSQF